MTLMQFDIWSFMLIIGIGQGIFALTRLKREHLTKLSVNILGLLIVILSLHLTEFLILNSGYYRTWPHLMRLTEPLLFLIGPAFYVFTVSSLKTDFRLSWRHSIHLVPFVLSVIYICPWFFTGAESKIIGYERMLTGGPTGIGISGFIYAFAHIIITLAYSYGAHRELRKTNVLISSSAYRFIKRFTSVFLGYWIIQLTGLVVITLVQYYIFYIDYTLALINAFFIQFLAYKMSKGIDLTLTVQGRMKYEGSKLSEEGHKVLVDGIISLVQQQVYLDSELNMQKFANMLNINKSYLSQVINKEFGCGFPEFINEKRINHATLLMSDPDYMNTKLLAIALDSGFNNKTSFNRAFTRQMGQSPSEFRKELSTSH